MAFKYSSISYEETGFFSRIVLDYLSEKEVLQPFYAFPNNKDGIKAAIKNRKQFNTNRKVLVEALTQQYANYSLTNAQQQNLAALLNEDTFTITTAHQPNLFTGPLYVFYKILHVIDLAKQLNQEFPEQHFVPIFYMGSEDADFEELNHFTVEGKKYTWTTNQTGAVGRMKVDANLLKLINELQAQIGITPYGKEWINLLQEAYVENRTIQEATLHLLNNLFKQYGLLIVIPDNALLKKEFIQIVQQELNTQFSSKALEQTNEILAKHYTPQASGREINLFYLDENGRNRIEQKGDSFTVKNTSKSFKSIEIQEDVVNNPIKYSPNVVLRGLFQELILPNIIFVGGGGELAYWLQLKQVFAQAKIPYPVLQLRNSCLFINNKTSKSIDNESLSNSLLFKPAHTIIDTLARNELSEQLKITEEIAHIKNQYKKIASQLKDFDASLAVHTQALEQRSTYRLEKLEKKILRAAKKKNQVRNNRINSIKSILFPKDSLQERVENVATLYKNYGSSILDILLDGMKTSINQFLIIKKS